jgi:anti-sigma-K factor RskA
MSGDTDDTPLLAAEYALGSLDLAEMRDAEAFAARDPAFAAEIAWWDQRLASLATLVEPVTPPASLWARLALVTGARAEPKPSAWSRPGLWRATTAAALAVAAAFAAVALLPRATPEPLRLVAALAPTATPARFVVQSQQGRITLTPVGGAPAAAGRDYELWSLPKGATRPVALGVIAPGQQFESVPASQPDTQLLVSLEPSGGSPTGQPTGPVVYGGTLTPAN